MDAFQQIRDRFAELRERAPRKSAVLLRAEQQIEQALAEIESSFALVEHDLRAQHARAAAAAKADAEREAKAKAEKERREREAIARALKAEAERRDLMARAVELGMLPSTLASEKDASQ